MKILIVDDARSARLALKALLGPLGPKLVSEAGSLAEARGLLAQEVYDVALIDLRLGPEPTNRDGLQLVEELKRYPATCGVVVTGSHEMTEIRSAMRAGAYDYILKDELCEELVVPIVQGIAARHRLEREVVQLRARHTPNDAFEGIVGTSLPMARLRSAIERAATSDRPVLVSGPTGSGKELVVRALHRLGSHPEAPLIDVNCGGLPEQLIESQLFGHEKGAFTGADRRHEGYLAAVGEGTLFLDEIAELPLLLQAKLLRVLESGQFRRIGSLENLRLRGRTIAATHATLAERVREGRFREDLLYRLNVLELQVPSLDERREDIPQLVAHFVAKAGGALELTEGAIAAMTASSWPGNVRQLRNLIDRLSVFAAGQPVTAEVVEEHLRGASRPVNGGGPEAFADAILGLPAANKLDAAEDLLIGRAMALANGNKSQAARLLGVHRKVVERRLSSDGEDLATTVEV